MTEMLTGRSIYKLLLIATAAALTSFGPPAMAYDLLWIGDKQNNQYLPYGIDTIRSDSMYPGRPEMPVPYQPFRTFVGDSNQVVFVVGVNPPVGSETVADISILTAPKRSYLDEIPISLTITDYNPYRSVLSRRPALAVGGYRHDTSFVARILVGDSIRLYLPLSHGVDHDGDGVWRGKPMFVTACDYDFDGREEVFYWVNPVRDMGPRDLVCLDLDAGRIEWSVPVASGVYAGYLFPVRDSISPGVIFAAYGMGQGVRDSLFCSNYGYVAVVDQHGRVVHRRFASKFGDEIGINSLPGDSLFVLHHTLPLLDSEGEADSDSVINRISLIDRNLHPIQSIDLLPRITSIWISDYKEAGKSDIYCLGGDGVVRVYDLNLRLLSQSDPSTLLNLIEVLPNWGTSRGALVFSTTRGTEVYSRDFHKLVDIGRRTFCRPLALDSRGNMTAFLAGDASRAVIGRPVPRGWIQLMSLFYQDYQIWVLSILFSLVAALIVMNLYRSRVSHQKRDLAVAHAELAETHEALKRAQATIISQEKFRQAKDIAGAFAHEIRNALFPADSALNALGRLSADGTPPNPERLRSLGTNLRAAVDRAVAITDEILTYTRLDSTFAPEPVSIREVMKDTISLHGALLEAKHTRLHCDGPDDAVVLANRVQLGAVMSNLVLNSLDATAGQPSPSIRVDWRPQRNVIEIRFSDNGSGIPPDQLGRVFDAFYSTKPSTGTGLGLATCKKTIEMYGGSIVATCSNGSGATFITCLPAALNPTDPEPLTDTRSEHP